MILCEVIYKNVNDNGSKCTKIIGVPITLTGVDAIICTRVAVSGSMGAPEC